MNKQNEAENPIPALFSIHYLSGANKHERLAQKLCAGQIPDASGGSKNALDSMVFL